MGRSLVFWRACFYISAIFLSRPSRHGPAMPPHLSHAPSPSPAPWRRLDVVGVALALGGVALFSSKSILIKLAYRHGVDATTLMSLRMGFALPFYAAFAAFALWRQKWPDRPTTRHLPPPDRTTLLKSALVGCLGYYLASFLDLSGLQYISAQFERLILFTYPVFVLVLGALFYRQPLTRTALFSLILCYAGVAVIFAHDFKTFGPDIARGAGLVLASALTFAFYLLLAKEQIARLGSRLFTTTAMLGASLAVFTHFALTRHWHDLWQPGPVYAYAFAMALFATVIPSYLINEAVARIGPGPKSIFGMAGPVLTSFAAIFLLGEPFTLYHLAGMVLVLAGILWLSLGKSAPSPAAKPFY